MHLTGHSSIASYFRLLPAIAALLLLSACGSGGGQTPATTSNSAPLTKVTFMAGFRPQANLPFVGAYVAQEMGYFREQNLDVEIRHAASGEHLQLLLAGEIQFSTGNGAQVISRNAQGLEIVSLALIGQRSEQVFAVAANSNIRSIKDWEGKKFGYASSVPTEFLAIAKAGGIDPARVEQVRAGFDPRILSEGRVDILGVFAANEPDTLARQGFQTRVFDPAEFGVPTLGLTYITSRAYLEKNPEVTGRFLKSVLKGLEYASTNRATAIDIVMKYAPQEDKEHQRFMLDKEFDRGALTEATKRNGIGWQTQDQWKALHDSLLEFKAIEKSVDVSRVYTDGYLKQFYKNGKLVWP